MDINTITFNKKTSPEGLHNIFVPLNRNFIVRNSQNMIDFLIQRGEMKIAYKIGPRTIFYSLKKN